MVEIAEKQRARQSLIVGTDMVCPRCRGLHNILAYVRLGEIDDFAAETTPVYKCPTCKWMFAPADQYIAHMMLELIAERTSSDEREGG